MRLKFSELFEGLGLQRALRGSCRAAEVEIAGYVVDTHDGRAQMLVAEPGGCPHCSPVPAISLPAFRIAKPGAVTLRGVLSYGFFIDGDGNGVVSETGESTAGDRAADLILIQNALVLTPSGEGKPLDVLVDRATIADVVPRGTVKGEGMERVDAAGAR